MEFSRALNTGDEWDVAISSGETTIIWAMGYSGDNPQDGYISRHQYRAVNTVIFMETSINLPELTEPTCEVRIQ